MYNKSIISGADTGNGSRTTYSYRITIHKLCYRRHVMLLQNRSCLRKLFLKNSPKKIRESHLTGRPTKSYMNENFISYLFVHEKNQLNESFLI